MKSSQLRMHDQFKKGLRSMHGEFGVASADHWPPLPYPRFEVVRLCVTHYGTVPVLTLPWTTTSYCPDNSHLVPHTVPLDNNHWWDECQFVQSFCCFASVFGPQDHYRLIEIEAKSKFTSLQQQSNFMILRILVVPWRSLHHTSNWLLPGPHVCGQLASSTVQ